MWTKYHYGNLRGVIKVGDRVRYADKETVVTELIGGAPNFMGTEESVGFKTKNGGEHYFSDDYYQLERYEAEKLDVEVGDIVKDCNGGSRRVLEKLSNTVLLSYCNNFDEAHTWKTLTELHAAKYTKDTPKLFSFTMAEIANMVNVPVEQLVIIQDNK